MNFATITAEHIEIFILVLIRVTAMVALLPIFGSDNIPVQLKAGFSVLLAMMVYPYVLNHYQGIEAFSLPMFFIAVIKEVFVGVVIGFASSFLFAAVQFAGMLIDRQMGFAMVRLVDPTTQMPVTFSGQFHLVVFTMVFLVVNGHYFLVLAIQKSFEIIPLLGVNIAAGNIAGYLSTMAGNVFIVAVQFSAPIFTVLLLTTLGLAIVARTVPQINVFFVGMPLKIGVGIITTVIALPMLTMLFKSIMNNLIRDIWKLLHMMA